MSSLWTLVGNLYCEAVSKEVACRQCSILCFGRGERPKVNLFSEFPIGPAERGDVGRLL